MRFPFIRVGLLVIVGAVFASIMTFWTQAGAEAGDLARDTDLTRALDNRGALSDHFVSTFLFAGGLPGWLFYAGLLLVIVGSVRRVKGAPPRTR